MRDLFIVLLFPYLIYATVKKHYIGIGIWIWVALFYPGGWAFGFSQSLRLNLVIAALVLICLSKEIFSKNLSSSPLFKAVCLFTISFTISTIFAQSSSDLPIKEWEGLLKVMLLFFAATVAIKKLQHVNFILLCVALSVGMYGLLEALKFISSGGSHIIKGFEGHILGDRNDLSLAMNLTIPICIYLRSIITELWLKHLLLAIIFGLILAILGSFSRAGFVGLSVLTILLILNSRRKILLLSLATLLASLAITFVGSDWVKRMDTIKDAKEDGSFIGRMVAWKMSMVILEDHPFFGGGLKAVQTLDNWRYYENEDDPFSSIDTPPFTNYNGKAAHSIYFQLLGDLGIIGFLLYFVILKQSWNILNATIKKSDHNPPLNSLAKCFKMMFIVFLINGAALSMAYFELVFLVLAIINSRVFSNSYGKAPRE